jgi:hypothetical protein
LFNPDSWLIFHPLGLSIATLDRLSGSSLFGLLAKADGELVEEFLRESFY